MLGQTARSYRNQEKKQDQVWFTKLLLQHFYAAVNWIAWQFVVATAAGLCLLWKHEGSHAATLRPKNCSSIKSSSSATWQSRKCMTNSFAYTNISMISTNKPSSDLSFSHHWTNMVDCYCHVVWAVATKWASRWPIIWSLQMAILQTVFTKALPKTQRNPHRHQQQTRKVLYR